MRPGVAGVRDEVANRDPFKVPVLNESHHLSTVDHSVSQRVFIRAQPGLGLPVAACSLPPCDEHAHSDRVNERRLGAAYPIKLALVALRLRSNCDALADRNYPPFYGFRLHGKIKVPEIFESAREDDTGEGRP